MLSECSSVQSEDKYLKIFQILSIETHKKHLKKIKIIVENLMK